MVNIDCNFDYAYERQRLQALGAELFLQRAGTEKEMLAAAAEADILLLENADKPVTARVIAGLRRCRAIVKYGVGVDNIDIAAASALGIVVCNAADFCTEEVSDHAAGLLLAAARRITVMDRHVRAGGWFDFPQSGPIRRMNQLTLGLLGLGRIGRALAAKMAGFRMRIIAADPYVKALPPEAGIELVAMERLFHESDLLSIHVPLTPGTRGLVGEAAFRAMKPTAFVVNTSRGGVIDEGALIRALREKRIAGAALDVMAEEPLPAASPLREFDHVILTPHSAASSADSKAQLRATVVDSVAAVLAGRWPPFPVNPGIRTRFEVPR